MAWTIYCHTHTESGRRYVGLTSRTWQKRWSQHVNQANLRFSGWSHFQNAIRKYGKGAFEHEVLEICNSLETANEAEKRWIEKLETRNPVKGFNLMEGGAHVPHPIRNPWDRSEYREKMAGRNTPALLTPESRMKQKAAVSTLEYKGKRSDSAKKLWSDHAFREMKTAQNKEINSRPEVKRKIGDAARGRVFSEETRRKISENNAGKTINPDVIAKISATLKAKDWSGKVMGPETRRKVSEALRQRKTSQETRDKISASGRARPKATHCKRGHEYTSVTTFTDRNGKRECRICSRLGRKRCYQARMTATRAKNKAA